jgi:hypothetical protein
MSNDLFKENTPLFEQSEERDEEEIVSSIANELNHMFTRENLETYPYIVFKMNSRLEIPITALYKDKRISTISTNLALIREGLARSQEIIYDKEKEIIRPKIKALKNKILLNKILDNEKNDLMRTIYDSPEYSEKASDKYLENVKSYNIVMKNEESAATLVEKIRAKLGEKSQTELVWEYEDLYLNLVQKAQDSMKYQSQNMNPNQTQPNTASYDPYMQNYNYYYGMNPYGNPYMMSNPYGYRGGMGYGGNNYYYNNSGSGYYNQMFIRKAQDEPYDQDQESPEYGGRYGGGRKKERYHKKGQGKYRGERGDRGEGGYRERDRDRKTISAEEIEKKTMVNQENFPPLVSTVDSKSTNIIEALSPEKKDKEEKVEPKVEDTKRVRYDRHALIDIFKKISPSLKPNEVLKTFNNEEIPIFEVEAQPSLEFITPSIIVRKESRGTPKINPLTPKQNPK